MSVLNMAESSNKLLFDAWVSGGAEPCCLQSKLKDRLGEPVLRHRAPARECPCDVHQLSQHKHNWHSPRVPSD